MPRGVVIDEVEDELEEEPGEEIESAPPLRVGEERVFNNTGLKKKLLKRGLGWESPNFGDEVTVHYTATLLDGTKFVSTRDRGEPVTFKPGSGEVVAGLDDGITTMKKGECALFTLPPELGYGVTGRDGVPPNSVVQFEVELLSWITVVDVCRDGGIIKKIIEKGQRVERPTDLDEVLVKYQVALADGAVVSKSSQEGVEFYVKDGKLCPAMSKAIVTMQSGEKAKLIVQPQYGFGDEGKKPGDGIDPIPSNSVLNIDLELVSFKHVVDVSGDAKVLKKILKEGEGSVADEGAKVTSKLQHAKHYKLYILTGNFRVVGYTARLEDGTIFERKGVDGDEPMQFITDEEQVIPGLDEAAATMKKGEHAIVTINSEYGFGSVEVKKDLATVPPCSVLVYEVEMLDFIKEKPPWEIDDQGKIETAERIKEEGNVLFRSGKYQRAGKKYDKAASYISEEFKIEDGHEKQVKALRVSCWLNGAACSLKLKDTQEAIKLCSKVLDIEFNNVKALYRRAQAYKEAGDFVAAELDVKRALEVDPKNREVKAIQKQLRQLESESKRDSRIYKNMFAPAKDAATRNKRRKLGSTENEKVDGTNTAEAEEAVDNSGLAST